MVIEINLFLFFLEGAKLTEKTNCQKLEKIINKLKKFYKITKIRSKILPTRALNFCKMCTNIWNKLENFDFCTSKWSTSTRCRSGSTWHFKDINGASSRSGMSFVVLKWSAPLILPHGLGGAEHGDHFLKSKGKGKLQPDQYGESHQGENFEKSTMKLMPTAW